MTDAAQSLKQRAAAAVIDEIADGMVVGLGTGSTAALAIDALAAARRSVRCVATSRASERQASSLGLRVVGLDEVERIDLTFDGADEIDPDLHLIKGLGGALLREKLVALASDRQVIIGDASKLVAALGERCPLPVEVVPFGLEHTRRRLQALGAQAGLRRARDGSPIVTDNGNHVLDCRFSRPIDAALGAAIKATAGVVEHGLFWAIAHHAWVAYPDGRVVRLEARRD